MTWIDRVLDSCPQRVVVNDSKTPSGRAHVGSLRGVLIHDALARAARERGLNATFMYGCDDMDPVDEKPHGTGDQFVEHQGKPLWAAPPPEGLRGDSMAEAYFGEFTGKWFDATDSPVDDAPGQFDNLGVEVEFYRMSDIYRAGRLDEIIDTFLRAAADVRQIYLRLSGAERSDDWLPFQPICEACGRIGTTYASGYDGETVAYECRPHLVTWAEGCGHSGRISPFGGNGKLPWKLEWAAKWKLFGVSIEGAGKDHMAASGSHEVSSALARQVLQCPVPVPVPYEFFTLGGAKMSSSKGIGMTASELTAMLPPELLRYVVLRTQPRRAIDFALDIAGLTKAFVEYERLWRAAAQGDAEPNQQQLFFISQVDYRREVPTPPAVSPPFDSVVSLAQQPHIELANHVASLGVDMSEADAEWLAHKEAVARKLMESRPDLAGELALLDDAEAKTVLDGMSNQQRAFLYVASSLLRQLEDWSARSIQSELFDAARLVGCDERSAIVELFTVLYALLFGRSEGPRAGSFLEFYGKRPTLERLDLSEYSYSELVDETAVPLIEWDAAVHDALGRDQRPEFLPLSRAGHETAESTTDGEVTLEAFIRNDGDFLCAVRTVCREALKHVAAVLQVDDPDVPIRSSNPFARGSD
ncbi:lysine--tRNA ligase [Candidatus Poriferisodalis sp.]|uniref:lysine--tRNA ligase n=1 Tax=Candidatus Poriferisodalis sp. TaxID=3101277 RepID=UPI003AF4C687